MVPSRIAAFFGRRRLQTVPDLAAFVAGQAARVSQIALLDYLRARMGTQWPKHFEEPAFAPSLRRAQTEGFHICLSDLVVYAIGQCSMPGPISGQSAINLYEAAYAQAVTDGKDAADVRDDRLAARFADRVGATDWDFAATTAFDPSLRHLIDCAPVSRSFAEQDREAFTNGLTLKWVEVGRRFIDRADCPALAADFRRLSEPE